MSHEIHRTIHEESFSPAPEKDIVQDYVPSDMLESK